MSANDNPASDIRWRDEVATRDLGAVHHLVVASAVFSREEQAIAVELVQERLQRGASSGYEFLLADRGSDLLGYTCFGRIPGTRSSFDLYWIVTSPGWRHRGLGRMLLTATEERIRAMGGTRVFVDTSSGPAYLPARSLYQHCGYCQEAVLKDYHAPGDDKVIFSRTL
jgi:ribosomal protein S18 acetylase RimI-like enzyme